MAISQILIPTLTSHIGQTRRQGVADLHPLEWQFHRFWFLLKQLKLGRPGVADLPLQEQQFHRFWFLLWQLIFGRPGVADLTPLKWQFHRFLLWQFIYHVYSESSYLADWVMLHIAGESSLSSYHGLDLYTLTDLGMIPDLYMVGRCNMP